MRKKNTSIKVIHYLELIAKWRWLIIIPFCIAMVVGTYLAFTLPAIYEASTLILVEPQSVPIDYVRSIVTSDIDARISAISHQILSRTNLENVIRDFGLFSTKEFIDMPTEDRIKHLRKRIEVKVSKQHRDTDAFTISFKGKNQEIVMRVANGLGSYFIEENLKVREEQAMGTSSFLDGELASQRERLEEMDRNLRDYRRQYMGQLPEQLETNLRIMGRLADKLNEKQKQLRDARNRLISLSQIAGSDADERESSLKNIDLDDLDNITDLSQLRKKLESLKSRYTEIHPDVVRVQKKISELEKELEDSAIDPEATKKGEIIRDLTRSSKTLELVNQIEIQQAQIKNEIATLESEIKETDALIKLYQKRVENTPKREEELRALTRDYKNIQNSYSNLLNRKLTAELSLSMERKQKGEQFRIIDRARFPESPVAPDLQRLFLVVTAVGFGLGCGIIFLIDYFDSSLKHPEEFEEELGLTVMAMIPTIHHTKFHILMKLNFVFTVFGIIAAAGLLSIFAIVTVLKGPAASMEVLSKVKGILASVI